MQITAKKGVKLFHDFYIDMDIRPYTIPKEVKIPLGFKREKIEYRKNIGDRVEKFDVIANVKKDLPVYSSVNGKIIDFCMNLSNESNETFCYAVVETDGCDSPSYPLWDVKSDYSKFEILDIIKKAGIINETTSGYFIDFINKSTKYKKIIIDCVDDQPYDLAGTSVLLNHKKEVLAGAEILAKAFKIPKIELLIMKNFRTENLIKSGIDKVDIVQVNGKYPAEPEIVQYAHKNIALRVGVQCCRALYRAAFFGEPQLTSVVTVWGEGLDAPANCEVLNGTPTKFLLKKCAAKGILERVVAGGVMTGYVISPELPVLRWNTALTVMPLKRHSKTFDCVNCGRCADICPMKLAPYFILRSSNKAGEKIAKQLCAGMCIYCGACSYICPSRQPLGQKIREYNDFLCGGSGK